MTGDAVITDDLQGSFEAVSHLARGPGIKPSPWWAVRSA